MTGRQKPPVSRETESDVSRETATDVSRETLTERVARLRLEKEALELELELNTLRKRAELLPDRKEI